MDAYPAFILVSIRNYLKKKNHFDLRDLRFSDIKPVTIFHIQTHHFRFYSGITSFIGFYYNFVAKIYLQLNGTIIKFHNKI